MQALSPAVISGAAELSQRFARRAPFRHLIIDDFFAADFVQRLLQEFPAFERGNARNEQGELGGKSVVERIRELGPAFAQLDALVQSREFLCWLSQATGIPDLLYDPWYFGGGTHDNRHGQELDPHVDFNRHPENGWHRRLNLIVYLNPEWDSAWGGSLELHSDPRSGDNWISTIVPLFNRGVIFETTDWSWHGFSKIALPEDRRALSRKSIALYFYTRERPMEELALTHSTIYVDRPLPERFRPGHVLSDDDVQELQVLLARRDQHIQRLYGDVIALQARIDDDPPTQRSNSAHLARLYRALRDLAGILRTHRRRPTRTEFKSALLPFVRELPTGLRDPLRKAWRRWNAAR